MELEGLFVMMFMLDLDGDDDDMKLCACVINKSTVHVHRVVDIARNFDIVLLFLPTRSMYNEMILSWICVLLFV